MLQGLLRFVLAGMCLISASAGAASFTDAREAYRKGDHARLEKLAEEMGDDVLAIYPRYWLLARKLSSVDEATVHRFLEQNRGSYLADRLLGDWLKELARRGDWASFDIEYPALADKTVEMQCFAWQGRLARQDRSFESEARRLWMTPKELPSSCTPVFEDLIARAVLAEDVIWARVRLAFDNGQPGLARYLLRFLKQELAAKEADLITAKPQAALDGADLSSRLGRELALYALGRVARTDPDAALQWIDARRDALAGGDEAWAWRVLAMQGARKHDARAVDWFRMSEALPFTEAQQEWRVRIALRQENWATVEQAINSMQPSQRNERAWQYWLGRALEKRGKTGQANRILAILSQDDDYYGLLARERLGPLVGASAVYEPTVDDVARVQSLPGVQRALQLNDFGLRFEAAREWNWAMRGLDDRSLLAAADLANRFAWYDRAIYAAERTKVLHNYNLRYLTPYREVTKSYSMETGLDEAWVFGLIRQESRFVNVARSGVGASGLMQLMPGTAQWVANRLGIKYHAAMVNEVGTNVQLGTYYLSHVQQTLSNSPVLATAGYNAGPNRAREWQADRVLEAAIYVESIPFLETRDYVKKVMSNAHHYALTFGQGKQSITARMGMIPARSPKVIEGP